MAELIAIEDGVARTHFELVKAAEESGRRQEYLHHILGVERFVALGQSRTQSVRRTGISHVQVFLVVEQPNGGG